MSYDSDSCDSFIEGEKIKTNADIEKKIFPVYNENNFYITKEIILSILKLGNVYVTDIGNLEIWQKAFIHKSISKLSNANNERLEFVGDRVLGLTLSNELLKLYPNDTEGDLDKKLASLVNKQACAEVIEDYKLGKFLVLSSSQKKNKVGHKKIYGDLCESLIGAVFIDQGYEVANKFVLRLWKKKLKKS